MKKAFTVILVTLIGIFTASCGTTPKQDDKLTVYASFYAMSEFVQAVGGDDVICESVAPLGSEPHSFEPTARDMAKLSEADVFVYSGFGIDDWAADVAETLPDTVTVVCASENLTADGNDPHVWLSLENAQIQLETIYKYLSAEDSENSEKYLDRLTQYCAQIDELEKEYENAGLNGRRLFVTHGAYGYLCAEFGMEQTALEGISGDSDPSPAQTAAMVEQIKDEGAKCIYYDPLEGDKTASAVAAEAGITAEPLYTFEGDGENRDYVTIMKLNLEQLKKGL